MLITIKITDCSEAIRLKVTDKHKLTLTEMYFFLINFQVIFSNFYTVSLFHYMKLFSMTNSLKPVVRFRYPFMCLCLKKSICTRILDLLITMINIRIAVFLWQRCKPLRIIDSVLIATTLLIFHKLFTLGIPASHIIKEVELISHLHHLDISIKCSIKSRTPLQ